MIVCFTIVCFTSDTTKVQSKLKGTKKKREKSPRILINYLRSSRYVNDNRGTKAGLG